MVFPVLKGKTAIITGAGSGMGRETAILFGEAGANVVVGVHHAKDGQAVVDEIKAKGGNAIFVEVDVSDEASVEQMVQKTVESFGSLDCAVNNAAAAPDGRALVDFISSEWDRVMSVDLKGTAICLKYEVRQMMKQEEGGSIVNIASAIAEKVQTNSPAYVSAKCGVLGLTRAAAIEYGLNKIRINSVCPGIIQTKMLDSFCEDRGITPKAFAEAATSLGRFATPIEVAQASLWLCSDAASYMSGANLDVDGGYSQK